MGTIWVVAILLGIEILGNKAFQLFGNETLVLVIAFILVFAGVWFHIIKG